MAKIIVVESCGECPFFTAEYFVSNGMDCYRLSCVSLGFKVIRAKYHKNTYDAIYPDCPLDEC